ncbi:MAG: hypothetical protein M3R02_15130 [Chloroflexota bacterium]|nr:hypothetical protein [Chloroflexota bacterium]
MSRRGTFQEEQIPGGWLLGLDLGQAQDFSAIVLVERVITLLDHNELSNPADDAWHAAWDGRAPRSVPQRAKRMAYHVRRARRLPLGTPYPEVVQEVGQALRTVRADALASAPPLSRFQRAIRSTEPPVPILAVDATGVGRPVVDMIRAAGLPAHMVPVTITGGNAVTPDGDGYMVPKRDLVAAVQVPLQTGGLKFPKRQRWAETLRAELSNFRVKVSLNGSDTYGAWRERDHDDLVLALALAIWCGQKLAPVGPL